MFVVDRNPQFTHSITVNVPVNGGIEQQVCKATFRVVPTSEMDAFDLSEVEGTIAFLRSALVEMADLADTEGAPLPWNDEIRDLLLDRIYVRSALVTGYFKAVSGARAGN